MGKRSGNANQLVGGIIIIAVVLAIVPWRIWLGFAIVGLGIIATRQALRNKPSPEGAPRDERTLEEILAQTAKRPPTPPAMRPVQVAQPSSLHGDRTPPLMRSSSNIPLPESLPEFHTEPSVDAPRSPSTFQLPSRPPELGPMRWIPPGQTVNVAGITLPGGLIYVGTADSDSSTIEPSLVEPRLHVGRTGDFTVKQTDYWSSYRSLSTSARRAYLNWLAMGRRDPTCDIGFVFLFFYGLERRVILDGFDQAGPTEWQIIANEIRQLLEVYGESSASFRGYGRALLDWMSLDGLGDRLYESPVPSLVHGYELPWVLKLILGQAAQDRAPLPAAFALAWVRYHPAIYLRTPGTRCVDEFDRLFVARYRERWGDGMVLPKNRTKLKASYRPSSSALHGSQKLTRNVEGLPDVTVLSGPVKQLQDLANQCTDELDAYSRAIGKDEQLRNTPGARMLLPHVLWPGDAQTRIEALRDRCTEEQFLILPLGELLEVVSQPPPPLANDKIRVLAGIFTTKGLGLEPDILQGARVPTLSDPIVLFPLLSSPEDARDSTNYALAMLTLQLAATGARADGEFSAIEEAHLSKELAGWTQLTAMQRHRLQAHLRWLTVTPVSLATLKKKLAPLDTAMKERMAALMVNLAQVDGAVSPAEMKFLEKVYAVLGIDSQRLFSDVHAVASGGMVPGAGAAGGLRLDTQRIQTLQRDTAKVTALLSTIFQDAQPEAAPAVEHQIPPLADTGLLGLDEPHSTLARLLLSRLQWTRAELQQAAADLSLMLDGALEIINDAAFEAYDLPLTEGEDPIEVNVEVAEKLET